MALNQKQKDLLDSWSKTQAGWSNGQVDGNPDNDLKLGTMLASGKVLDDNLRDDQAVVTFSLPAPSGAAVNIDFPLVVAPTGGSIVSANLLVPQGISNTSTTASGYQFSVYRLNTNTSFSGALNLAVPVQTGVTANTQLRMPTGTNNVLLTATASYSITATASSLQLNCGNVTSSFVTQPNIGDWIMIGSANVTQFGGANQANVGVYQVTAASVTAVVATKANALTNPVNVPNAAAIAGDATGVRLIKSAEAAFYSGDMLAVRATVPAASASMNVTTQIQVQLRLRYSF